MILNNTWQPDWNDVAFDLSLKAMLAPALTPTLRLSAIHADANGINLGLDAPIGSDRRVEYNDTFLNGGTWQPLMEVTNRAGGTVTFLDSGAVERLAPRLPPPRFYRLSPK